MARNAYFMEFFCLRCYKNTEERHYCFEEHTLHRKKYEHDVDCIFSCLECHAKVEEIICVIVYFQRTYENIFKCTCCDLRLADKDGLQFHAECGCFNTQSW
ncbi:hypothetical protein CEXT_4691 [Caerostris extrusa]|uniref:Uncharacterized protein n=1 Tax=Caerostris extrusa TaxID=172846 RepID=A0AAV4Y3T1_CAEEX|nr:hypothetical protein CEXT_4691 [Caerostris extrusa]